MARVWELSDGPVRTVRYGHGYFLPQSISQLPPKPSFDQSIFKNVPAQGSPRAIYDVLVCTSNFFQRIILLTIYAQEDSFSRFTPRHHFIYTDSNLDPLHQLNPNVAVYSIDTIHRDTTASWTELKSSRNMDPFQDPQEGADRVRWSFERNTSKAACIQGQLASYTIAHMTSRFRLHSITLLILGMYARFIRWDRSAAIVSKRFKYVEQPTLLVDYLWGLSHTSDKALGIINYWF